MKINKNIYLKEMRLNRNSFIVWSTTVGAVIFLGMAFYPVLMEEQMLEQLTAFFENPFMKGIMTAFGAGIEVLTNVLGFYSTRNAIFIMPAKTSRSLLPPPSSMSTFLRSAMDG